MAGMHLQHFDPGRTSGEKLMMAFKMSRNY